MGNRFLLLLYILSYASAMEFLRQTDESINPDVKRNFWQICASLNVTAEEHFVTTEDNYILRMFRISGMNKPLSTRVPVYMQHGLIDSSDTWIINSPALAPGFILANLGYDVWLGNSRGNKYSRNHTYLNPNTDVQFWNFTWQQMAEFDLPAQTDYVLNATGYQKLAYVGHSQGTTQMLAHLSESPRYSEKLYVACLLAPIGSVSNQTSTLLWLLARAHLPTLIRLLHINEVLTSPKSHMLSYLCYFAGGACTEALYLLADVNTTVDNVARMDVIMSHYPAGTSSDDIFHWVQMADQKYDRMQKFDYGSAKLNEEIYGSATPPVYNLGNVKGNLALFAGLYDRLADPKDVEWLMTQLPKESVVWFKGDYPCGHGTWIWGKDMGWFQDVVKVIGDHV